MVKVYKPQKGKKNAKQQQKKNKKFITKRTGNKPGPLTRIDTAPVAIGNSIRGAESRSQRTPNGVVVTGRDFMFTPIATGAITTWCLVGGVPLSPAAFADSSIRQYMQMYQRFRWRRAVVHYITSSPTTASGDIMFYHAKNRESVFLNQTSNYLLPFVISDPDTVLGPQWTNHSAALTLQSNWKSTDYGMTSELELYSEGEIFLLSKTSTTDSPGYVLFDYEVEFMEMNISPRLLALPLPRAQWNQLNVGETAFSATQGNGAEFQPIANGIAGAASALPTGATAGDIYKVILDVTNSVVGSWTNATAANLLQLKDGPFGGETAAIAVSDGFTCYATLGSTNIFTLYPNVESAFTQSNYFQLGFSAGGSAYNLQVWMSLVGTIGVTNFAPNY